MKTAKTLFFLAVLLSTALTCPAVDTRSFDESIKTSASRPTGYPAELIELPNAVSVRYYELGGTYQLTYAVQMDYPANEAIALVSKKLTEHGWKTLNEDYLNPSLPSSHVRGWQRFDQPYQNPPQTVHQWLADWENQTGDIVRYGFIYQHDRSKEPDFENLHVLAIFVPSKMVKQDREEVLEEQRARGKKNK